jgi:hypothetical protein
MEPPLRKAFAFIHHVHSSLPFINSTLKIPLHAYLLKTNRAEYADQDFAKVLHLILPQFSLADLVYNLKKIHIQNGEF